MPRAPQQAYGGSSRGALSPPAPCRTQSTRAAGTPGGWGLLPGCFKKPSRKTQSSLGISSSGCQIEDDSQPSQEEQFGRKIHWRKKKKILILTCPPTHSHFPLAHPLAVCSHLGAMRERRRQKDLEKNIISSVGFVVEHGHGSEAQPLALPTLGSLFQLGALGSSRGISASKPAPAPFPSQLGASRGVTISG